ncbi:hypothetical protein [Aquiflexum lacus]|uniref:hypothetical protein n=1 Tax=Aquiflexum lacus TaxID=2483805 RepID=UPI001893322B|nr:hypothetical protein [Aquiflexum lacus]
MTDAAYYLKIISTFSVLLPFLSGLGLGMHKLKPYPLFLVFLFFGFLIDLTGWYMYITNNTQGNWFFRYAYSLVEPLFYFWWIGYFSQSKVVVKLTKIFMLLSFLFWLLIIFYQPAFSTYYIFTEVSLAFFAGFLVLEIVEGKKEKSLPLSFWIVFGIFFYNFCTFFVKGLLNTQIATDLWFIQNVVNIITNLIFALGFWMGRSGQLSNIVLTKHGFRRK